MYKNRLISYYLRGGGKLKMPNLEVLLDGSRPDISQREIWIWGVGETSFRYQEDVYQLSEEWGSIMGYCDNNRVLWGEYNGLPVISPQELERKENVIVLICSWQRTVQQEVGEQLAVMGKEWYSFDEFVLRWHREDVLRIFHMLEDDFSREVYATMIWGMIFGGDRTARVIEAECLLTGNAYLDLPAFAKLDKEEVFVDCGAYVGDTVENYLFCKYGMTKKVIAFEPDEKSFAALEKRRERLLKEWGIERETIQAYSYAVGEKDGVVAFDTTEDNARLGSRIVAGDKKTVREVRVVTLDGFIAEPYSQIKIDVVGAEHAVLQGGRNGIKKWKPNIAVSLSNGVVDVYRIPLLLKELVPQYRFAVRHHRNNMCMTLYAWVDEF